MSYHVKPMKVLGTIMFWYRFGTCSEVTAFDIKGFWYRYVLVRVWYMSRIDVLDPLFLGLLGTVCSGIDKRCVLQDSMLE